MATTVQQLINRSLELCGRLGAARTPGPAESGDALLFLNTLVDNFNEQRRYVCGLDTVPVTITSGTRAYALSTRPVHIERAEFVVTIAGQSHAIPVEVLGIEPFNAIPKQGVVTPYVKGLYCDYAFPTANIYLAPTPAAGALKLYTWQLISAFAALTDTVTVPPGILRALQYALAVELAPIFGKELTPALVAGATDAAKTMESLNLSHVYGMPALKAAE